MAYKDFINGFTKLEICSLGPEAMVSLYRQWSLWIIKPTSEAGLQYRRGQGRPVQTLSTVPKPLPLPPQHTYTKTSKTLVFLLFNSITMTNGLVFPLFNYNLEKRDVRVV